MNKKEIAEVKKQFTKENATITRICGCYVDADGETKMTFRDAYLSLEEEEQFKYLELFKKSLSGSVGKSLFNFTFPLQMEQEEGGFHKLLLRLKDTKLQDDDVLDEYYGELKGHLQIEGNYLILVTHAMYDVPGKGTDNQMMEDASDTVYEYLLTSICPVNQTKPGLSYDDRKETFKNRTLEWIVDPPSNAFLFPAFNDRAEDIHSLLFYAKGAKYLQEILVTELFQCPCPVGAEQQKEAFVEIVENSLDSGCSFEAVQSIMETISDSIEESKEESEPLTISADDLYDLIGKDRTDTESLDSHKARYAQLLGSEEPLTATNLVNGKMEIKTEDATIQVKPERASLIRTETIDGRLCFVIPIDGQAEVNGIRIRN